MKSEAVDVESLMLEVWVELTARSVICDVTSCLFMTSADNSLDH